MNPGAPSDGGVARLASDGGLLARLHLCLLALPERNDRALARAQRVGAQKRADRVHQQLDVVQRVARDHRLGFMGAVAWGGCKVWEVGVGAQRELSR